MPDLQILLEFIWIISLAVYAFSFIFFTKKIYEWMLKKGIKKSVAVYYNRKLIHIFVGGVVVLAVPLVFTNPWYPLFAGVFLSVIMYFFHRSNHILYWFQHKKDLNDVSFCLMWGVAIFVLWMFFNDPWIAVIPPAFIAFGDGITGIVRNFAFKERHKHPIGNIYMAGVCILIGFFFARWSGIPGLGLWGVIAALVASVFERYEIGPIDDNILITISATIILYIGGTVGPIVSFF
jgi:hypothetical protein